MTGTRPHRRIILIAATHGGAGAIIYYAAFVRVWQAVLTVDATAGTVMVVGAAKRPAYVQRPGSACEVLPSDPPTALHDGDWMFLLRGKHKVGVAFLGHAAVATQ